MGKKLITPIAVFLFFQSKNLKILNLSQQFGKKFMIFCFLQNGKFKILIGNFEFLYLSRQFGKKSMTFVLFFFSSLKIWYCSWQITCHTQGRIYVGMVWYHQFQQQIIIFSHESVIWGKVYCLCFFFRRWIWNFSRQIWIFFRSKSAIWNFFFFFCIEPWWFYYYYYYYLNNKRKLKTRRRKYIRTGK